MTFLSFAAYQCKDSSIESKYYGICLVYHRQTFLEMIPTRANVLLLTLFDAQTNTFETRHVTEDTDIHTIQEIIKEKYNMVADQDDHG